MRSRLTPLLYGAVGALVAVALLAATVQPPFVNGPIRDLVPEPTQFVNARVLAAATAETVTVPSAATGGALGTALAQEPGSRIVVAFSASCASYYVRVGGTATVPAADTTDGSSSVRNPSRLVFDQAATFSIISPDACIVTLGIQQTRF